MDAPLSPGTILYERYEILKLLGGDFGTVYQARKVPITKTTRFVTIKQMPAQMIVVCERLADLRPTLIHPTIPRILDYFTTDDQSFLVQQFIEGSDLETILAEEPGFLPECRVIHWAIQLCAALDYLHNHPVHPLIFRDLKPNNVVVDRAEQIHLVDFELAREFPPGYFQETPAHLSHYRKGLAIGTEGYSPPEQYRGRLKPQSDLYALGATLHHLLTRRDPRQAEPFTFRHYPIRSSNPSVSRELAAIVMKALNHDINRRFATAKEMQTALEKLVA